MDTSSRAHPQHRDSQCQRRAISEPISQQEGSPSEQAVPASKRLKKRERGAPEGVHVARLVLAREALLVPGTVLADVLHVRLGELVNAGHDGVHAAILAHRLGREIGVCACAVPVTLHGLGVQRAGDAVGLTQAATTPPAVRRAPFAVVFCTGVGDAY